MLGATVRIRLPDGEEVGRGAPCPARLTSYPPNGKQAVYRAAVTGGAKR